MKVFQPLLVGLAFSDAQPSAAHPSLYSFADVYRLTVGGPLGGAAPAMTEAPVRVAAVQGVTLAEPRFSVATVPQPDTWLLLLAGFALAGWVAHRRLAR
jgi:hypothetical protein